MTNDERDEQFYRDTESTAFPKLDDGQLALLEPLGKAANSAPGRARFLRRAAKSGDDCAYQWDRYHLRNRLQFQRTILCTLVENTGNAAKEYKEGGSGATISFAVGESSLGPILVAWSEKGVCDVSLISR